jgi:hypothetical protein
MKIRRNLILFVCTVFCVLIFSSVFVEVLSPSPAQAQCVNTPLGRVCDSDVDPTRRSRPQLPRFGRIDVNPNSFMSYTGAC